MNEGPDKPVVLTGIGASGRPPWPEPVINATCTASRFLRFIDEPQVFESWIPDVRDTVVLMGPHRHPLSWLKSNQASEPLHQDTSHQESRT